MTFFSRRPVCVLLPVAVCLSATGCQHRTEAPPTPARVFIDGQIQKSADILALAQRRIATTKKTAQAKSGPAATTALSSILIKGQGDHPVVYLSAARNLTLEQWIQRILPRDWQLRWQNAVTSHRTTRIASFSGNDQWHRVLNTLLKEQHLYGHLDTGRKQLTITSSAQEPDIQPTYVPTSGAAHTTTESAKNPFSGASTASVAAVSPTAVQPRWTAEKGSTLRNTLQGWAKKAPCSTGGNWRVIWQASVDYPVDAPVSFTGDWNPVLTQVFTLYGRARTPLFATVYPRQCIVAVTDQSR